MQGSARLGKNFHLLQVHQREEFKEKADVYLYEFISLLTELIKMPLVTGMELAHAVSVVVSQH